MSIAITVVRALIEAVERSGVPRREFLSRGRLSEERLHGDERVSAVDFDALGRLALDMTGNEALGLHLAEHASEAAFDLLGHLISHAPTLRDALGLATQFGLLLFEDTHLAVDERLDTARIRHDFRRTSPRADRMHAEFVVAGFGRLLRIFGGPSAAVSAAYFEHAAPAHRHEYHRLFGGAEKFGQRFTGLEFPRHLLDARQLHQHPRLYALLHAEAHRTLEGLERGTGYADRLRRYLLARPASRIPNMDVAARELGLSVRSLRRRLTEEGVSYRELVAATLEEAAANVLRAPGGSVQKAAHVAGFSDPSAFHRAFKQWTGVTPTEFQRRSPVAM